MKQMQTKTKSSITHLFIYALTFLLVWEWLRPIPVITATGQMEVFIWFTLFSAVLVYFRMPAFITAPLVFGGSLFGLHLIFGEGSFLSREGGGATIQQFAGELTVNFSAILSGNFADLSDFFRTFLLFMLLALISYLLYFWVLHTRKVFFFLFSTIVYITILDTFTVVDASQAIVRVVVIGFFILTLLHMLNVQDEERAIGRRRGTFISPAWMYTLIIVVSTAVAAGFLLPKPEPQWADPVPALERFAGVEGLTGGGSGSGSVRRVGYGENDERLGGGFVQDDGPVFQAVTDRESYWRGESKATYTGQGWESEPGYVESELVFGDGIDYRMFQEAAGIEEAEVEIEMAEEADFSLLFYPGQLQDVLDVQGETDEGSFGLSELQFYTDVANGRFQARTSTDETVRFDSYTLAFEDAVFPVEALRGAPDEDPEEITERYLQLPDELPERVGELAADIASEYDNRYDTAVAVEQYFNQNDFEYQTTDVPVPEEGQDYVDQFLFETQVGYCDNYSTSMVVMLRTLDIPARWVKGFTSGEEVEELEDGRSVYEVANSNAHSWVEVYFPEVGWVPFEPTQGFTNYADFEEESVDVDIDTDLPDQEAPDPEIPEPDGDFDELLEEGADGGPSGDELDDSGEEGAPVFSLKSLLISIPMLIVVMVLYQKQNVLQNYYFMFRYRFFGSDKSFEHAYERLLWMLQTEGLPRRGGETLREYAKRIDMALSSQAMMKLTNSYERIYYGGRTPEGEWQRRRRDWEEIMRSLRA